MIKKNCKYCFLDKNRDCSSESNSCMAYNEDSGYCMLLELVISGLSKSLYHTIITKEPPEVFSK